MKTPRTDWVTGLIQAAIVVLFCALMWMVFSGCRHVRPANDPRPAIMDENRWIVVLPAGTVLTTESGHPMSPSIVRMLDQTDATLQEDGSLLLRKDLILTTTAYIQYRDQIELELLQRIEELRLNE